MKLPYRIVLSVTGLVVLLASAVFVWSAVQPPPDASRAARAILPAHIPVAHTAASAIRLAEVAVALPAPIPVEIPLSIDHPGSSTAADAIGRSIPIFDSPGAATPIKTLGNPTHEGFPLVFLVKGTSDGWLRVQLPVRPNETFGWVRAADVKTRNVQNHIVVEIAKRKLSAFNGSTLLMETPVGVGKSNTPTPPGRFYVDISIKNPGGPYGRHMLSVAGFSNVLKTFGTGIGQVAIHGTNAPASVGQFSSNGCMRLSNEAVLQLASLAPTGTPVFIVP